MEQEYYLDKMERELKAELNRSNLTDEQKEEKLRAFRIFKAGRERQLFG